jgi:hypothetical protein
VTVTDAIARTVAAELAKRRAELDALEGMRGLTIVVKLTKTREPRVVITTPQLETELR